MATRVTPLRLTACIALAAMFTLAGSASACGDAKAKAARSTASACATRAATTACAQPSAKAAAATTATVAAPTAPSAHRELPGITQPAPVVSGLMAYIDPESGLLCGPITGLTVPDDVARMRVAPLEFTPVTLPNGAVMVDLQGTLQDYFVLTIDPLGRRSIRCVQNPRQAAAPAGPAAPVAPVVHPIAER